MLITYNYQYTIQNNLKECSKMFEMWKTECSIKGCKQRKEFA